MIAFSGLIRTVQTPTAVERLSGEQGEIGTDVSGNWTTLDGVAFVRLVLFLEIPTLRREKGKLSSRSQCFYPTNPSDDERKTQRKL